MPLKNALIRARGGRGDPPPKQPELRPGDRLLERPAFILCSVRSGSTLLRVLLSSHSQIHCPHELHLRHIGVRVREGFPRKALAEAGLDRRHLRYLLWDRVLHRELAASGKRLLVNKTPNDVFIADRILECWPDARFIFLLRHPGAIARSRAAIRRGDTPEQNAARVAKFCTAVEEARGKHPGLTVRYEDLTSDPAATTRRLCEFLGVEWEPGMLDYGELDHGGFKPGLGDWSDKIKSGRVQAAEPPPEEIPPELRGIAEAWGYRQVSEPQSSHASSM